MVLISGPSGSGKTTTAGRLARLLEDNGCCAIPSQWITTSCRLPLRSSGSPRKGGSILESRSGLIPTFQAAHRASEPLPAIDVPAFDLLSRQKPGFRLEYKPGDIVIMEGIHALNPDVIGHSDEYTTAWYVSVRTRLESARAAPPLENTPYANLSAISCTAGVPSPKLWSFFKSVDAGENLYIMPYKHRASFDIDTSLHTSRCLPGYPARRLHRGPEPTRSRKVRRHRKIPAEAGTARPCKRTR